MGHLARDPECKFAPSGVAICNFCIGVTHKYKAANGEQREEVAWIDCAAWAKTGEVISQHLKKGDPIFVTGRLKTESWEKDGQKRSKLVLVVEGFQFIGGKRDGDSSNQAPRQEQRQAARSSTPANKPSDDWDDQSIPF